MCNTDSVATAADGFEFFEALFESFATRLPNLDGGISFSSIRKWQGELMDRETSFDKREFFLLLTLLWFIQNISRVPLARS